MDDNKNLLLGIIPEDWEVVNLGNVAKVNGRIGFRGYTVADLVPKGFGAITLSPSNIINNQIDYSNCTYISWYKYHESPEIKVRNGDILLVKTGSTFGKSAFVKDLPEKATINPQFVLLNNFKCDSRYLSYVIAHDIIQNQIHADIVGGAIPTLSQEKIANFTLFAPKDIAEQRAIASALSDVDGLIAALDKKIAKKRLLKQGAMQQLLTGKKRLPGFTDEWIEKSFADIFIHISTRNHQIDSSLYQSVGKYPIVDQGQIPIVGYTDDVEPIVCEQDGTIIFGDHTRIFKYVNYNFCVGADGTQVLFCKNNMCTKFIYYLCCIMEIPNTGYNRHYKYVKDNVYTIPSNIKEQQAIATILSDMDKEIADLEAQRDKYRLLKSGMMQKLLTGQIRLKTK